MVRTLRERLNPDAVSRVVELGPGPGVGLTCLLDAFPSAQVWGIDQSSTMLSQARRHNARAVRAGRLQLVRGDTSAAQTFAPLDVIVAVNVVYFWSDPVQELTRLRATLAPNGALALGYHLRPHVPQVTQQQFARAGHRLYGADDEIRRDLTAAGFADIDIALNGPVGGPRGRLAIARR